MGPGYTTLHDFSEPQGHHLWREVNPNFEVGNDAELKWKTTKVNFLQANIKTLNTEKSFDAADSD